MPFSDLRYYINTHGKPMAVITILVLLAVLGIHAATAIALSWFAGGVLEFYIKGCPTRPSYRVYGNGDSKPLSPNASVRVV